MIETCTSKGTSAPTEVENQQGRVLKIAYMIQFSELDDSVYALRIRRGRYDQILA